MNKTIKLNRKKSTKKKTLKLKIEVKKFKNKKLHSNKNMPRLNETIISVLNQLKQAMYMKKKRFSALGYDKSYTRISIESRNYHKK